MTVFLRRAPSFPALIPISLFSKPNCWSSAPSPGPQLSFWIDKDPCILSITAYFDILVDIFFLVQPLSPQPVTALYSSAPTQFSTYNQHQPYFFLSCTVMHWCAMSNSSYVARIEQNNSGKGRRGGGGSRLKLVAYWFMAWGSKAGR